MKFTIKKEFPSNAEFNELFQSVGWAREKEKINKIRQNSIFAVSVYFENEIVGMARVVGDGCYYTIYDVVVRKEFQGQGIGTIMMNAIIDWYKKIEDDDSCLYLGASKNKEKFYEKFGFVSRPYGEIGAGMKYDPNYKTTQN